MAQQPTFTLKALNAMPRPAAAAALAEVFERAPWVAEAAGGGVPYPTLAALHEAMMMAVRGAPAARQLELIRAHPELGSKVARAGLTAASQSEQGALGLDRLSDEEYARFQKLNAAYRVRFGFPFIICVRRHTRDSILRQFERRLANSVAEEQDTAINEIGLITRLRLCALIVGPGKPKTDGRLTTHVLDLALGRPAQGVHVALYEIGGSARGLLIEAITNADGRTDAPLLTNAPLRIGTYELVFRLAGYFTDLSRLFDDAVIRFSIAEPEAHYHVPLLVTPWSYSTYRGS
ncbi:MAG: 2-oxo-4-hydroxy-4-carboxy-5-ureidoimidazoline decarboxylase [Pseudolabrys sp.]|nr:2-oxo-4-hydroxy-4-carboxy-5-ureidoimidazoline decarboxylase [Pseudolabrys sp.]